MYWRDVTVGDVVTLHCHPMDGSPYHLVNDGIVYWMFDERVEANKALNDWAQGSMDGRKAE